MERFQNWTGILIEPDWNQFNELVLCERKSYALPVCLSVEPYPTRSPGQSPMTDNVQCFPLYSILLAVGRTRVDFFSLNVDGEDELAILKTIPWHNVDIQVIKINTRMN